MIGAKIYLKDLNDNHIAYYDYEKSGHEIKYTAQPIEIQQFQVVAKNELSGAEGEFEVSLTVKEG